jgi:hypothetical protein
MLLLKRIGTFLVLFVFLFVFLFIFSLFVGGAVAGASAGSGLPGATNFQSGFQAGYQAGHQAGAEFARRYTGIIFLGALCVSGVASLAISFSGVLPWCRKIPDPPTLP